MTLLSSAYLIDRASATVSASMLPNTAVRPNRIQNEKHYDLAGTFRKTYGKHL